MNYTRDQYVSLAKMAEQTKRYDQMADIMEKAVAAGGEKLTAEERNLIYTAFSNHVDACRETLRSYSSIRVPDYGIALIRLPIERKMVAICQRVVNLMDSLLQREVETGDSRVFYLKMKGDFHRYLAEANLALPGTDATEAALAAYKEAQVEIKRIVVGKWGLNNGQACIAPDYIITTKSFAPEVGFVPGRWGVDSSQALQL